MQKFVRVLAFMMAFVFCFSTVAFADSGLIGAAAYIVMDADSGEVLLEKNADDQMYPASITKMMTLALAYSKLKDQFDTVITVSENAANIPDGSTTAWFQEGENITVRDAMLATYLISANDGANVILEAAYGSIEAGVQAMNNQLDALGCVNGNFTNAHGFHNPAHHVSPRDMAKIVQWGLSIDGFKDFLKMTHHDIPVTNKTDTIRTYDTQNELVKNGNMKYNNAIGGKCGWTPQSGYTNVEIEEFNGHTLICVVMNCGGQDLRFYDCINLFEMANQKLSAQ